MSNTEAVEADVTTPREDGANRATATADLPGDEGSRWQPGEPVEADRLAAEAAANQRAELKEQRRRDAELRRASASGEPLVDSAEASRAAKAAAAAQAKADAEATAAAEAAKASQGQGG